MIVHPKWISTLKSPEMFYALLCIILMMALCQLLKPWWGFKEQLEYLLSICCVDSPMPTASPLSINPPTHPTGKWLLLSIFSEAKKWDSGWIACPRTHREYMATLRFSYSYTSRSASGQLVSAESSPEILQVETQDLRCLLFKKEKQSGYLKAEDLARLLPRGQVGNHWDEIIFSLILVKWLFCPFLFRKKECFLSILPRTSGWALPVVLFAIWNCV